MVRKAAAAAAVAKTRPTGDMIDELFALTAQKRELDAQKKPIQERIDALEAEIMAKLDEEKVDGSRGKIASVSVAPAIVATEMDWDVLWPWITKTKNFQLVVKNINQAAFREVLALETAKKREIPGIVPKEVRKLSLRKV